MDPEAPPGGRRPQQGRNRINEFPLRMVVDAQFVGAIIGQKGQNIREITRESNARCVIDVHKSLREQGALEKIINIYGQPECCSRACIKILHVVKDEMEKIKQDEGDRDNQNGDVAELKLRVHNQLVGRLIGKNGSSIKQIMEDSGCVIYVSNIGEINQLNMDRTISIKGKLSEIEKAEPIISEKLRSSWQNDLTAQASRMVAGSGAMPMCPYQSMAPAMMPGGGNYMPQMPVMYAATPDMMMAGAQNQQMFVPMSTTSSSMQPSRSGSDYGTAMLSPNSETVGIWVPKEIVGAVIGVKGNNIKNMMKSTGASIRIEGAKSGGIGYDKSPVQAVEQSHKTNGTTGDSDQSEDNPGASRMKVKPMSARDEEHENERKVVIIGNDQQQFQAQFNIFQQVFEHTQSFFDEIRLTTDVQVPTRMVGRIIGKSGQNVRELQRLTGAQLRILSTEDKKEEYTTIVIVANFNSSQAVQNRFRQILTSQSQQRSTSSAQR